jgi:hypothetical protein
MLPQADAALLLAIERDGALKIALRVDGEASPSGRARYETAMRLAGFGLVAPTAPAVERTVHGDLLAGFSLTDDGRAALRLERHYQAERRLEARRPARPLAAGAAGLGAAVGALAVLAVGAAVLWGTWAPLVGPAGAAATEIAAAAQTVSFDRAG